MNRLFVLLMCLVVAIVALVITYWPSPVQAAGVMPVEFICPANCPAEEELCSAIRASLEANQSITFDYNSSGAHMRFIVLPTAGGEHLAVTAAVLFTYPPLYGLSLSACFASFLVAPGGCDLETTTYISNYMVTGAEEWVIRNRNILYHIANPRGSVQEASNDRTR